MRATWLASVLRLAGCKVAEVAGWEKRGKELVSLDAVILHHTASGPSWTDANVTRLLREGRTDLPGPLAQLGLDRSGKFWVVAAGRCNHNTGEHGNQSVGIEAFNDGKGEVWPTAQLNAWEQGTAAILRHLGLPASRALGHREVDPRRKVDPLGVDLDLFRRNVARLLAPTPPTEVDDMARTCIPTNATRMPNNRFPFFRLSDDSLHVLAYNGAALRKVHGSAYGVPFMTLPELAARPVGICEAPGGAVVVVCEDGGTVDVAA